MIRILSHFFFFFFFFWNSRSAAVCVLKALLRPFYSYFSSLCGPLCKFARRLTEKDIELLQGEGGEGAEREGRGRRLRGRFEAALHALLRAERVPALFCHICFRCVQIVKGAEGLGEVAKVDVSR